MTHATIADATRSLANQAGDVRVVKVRALRGPNVAHRAPVLVAELRAGQLAELAPAAIPELLDRVAAALPSIAGEIREDGAPAPQPQAPSSWGDLLVRVARELQRLAGSPAGFARVTVDDPAHDRWTVVFGYDEEDLAFEAIRDAARIIRDCLRGDDPEIEATVSALARRYHRARPGPATLLMLEAARRRGIPVRRNPDDGVVQLGLGVTRRHLHGTMTDFTSAIATQVASDRHRTGRVLARVGLEMPEEDTARTLEGNDHRVVVVNGRVVACVQRVPAHVAPDGWWTIDRTDEMHPDNRALCELAAGAVGLDVAGLDVLTPDIAVPFRDNGAAIIEVIASPDIRMHTHPDQGTPRDVPGAILDMLYPPGTPTTIPVIAVTGTNGKTTTTRLIAHLFRGAGRTVGYTTTDGVYFQDHLLMEGDLTGPFAANVILSHPEVEVAVLETARGGILRSGLGFDECDVGVVLNVTSDHLGLRGIDTVEQLADVKGVIPSVVKPGGHTVLNADDPLVLAMRERTPGQVVLFTMKPTGASSAVEEHLTRGGIVARVEPGESGEAIVVRDGERRVAIAPVRDVPLTFGGQARFQVENVLAAVAAAYGQGLSAEQIRAGLMSFIPSAAMTPGRLNVIETTRGRIILDYAHNVAAIRGVLEFVAAIPAGRHLALISAPGDRRDDDLRDIGRLAAGMDYAIFKEHEHYRRGREPGAIARLMTEALLETGFPPDRTAAFVEERDAIEHALGLMGAGDVALIVTDDLPAVMEQLRPYLTSI